MRGTQIVLKNKRLLGNHSSPYLPSVEQEIIDLIISKVDFFFCNYF